MSIVFLCVAFFLTVPSTPEIYTLSLHDALPISGLALAEEKYGKLGLARVLAPAIRMAGEGFPVSFALAQSRSEEHTSELQSRVDLVCRLLLEKKKKKNQQPHHTHSN